MTLRVWGLPSVANVSPNTLWYLWVQVTQFRVDLGGGVQNKRTSGTPIPT